MSAWNQPAMNRVARILQRLGWVRKQVCVEEAVQGKVEVKRRWFYCRAPTPDELEMNARKVELNAAE
jgi:hypothetical protein